MNMLRRIVEFFVRCHFFIAFVVVCLILASYYPVNIDQVSLYYILFCFFGTWIVYALHSMSFYLPKNRVGPGDKDCTCNVLQSGFGLGIFFIACFINLYLSYYLMAALSLNLIIPLFISTLYVIPIGGKRLRDRNYIKIFLIALVWTWLTEVNPRLLLDTGGIRFLLVVERFLFILAITLPFDIRDYRIDQEQGVETLVSKFGIKTSKILSACILCLCIVLAFFSAQQGDRTWVSALAFGLSYTLAAIMCYKSSIGKSDLYFTGILDGLMALPFLFIQLLSRIM